MAIKFREAEVFWAVYKCRSVKDAANLLCVSQPAVSMMLKSAEERFGMRLFDRGGGRMQPTAEARHLFTYAETVFVGLHEFDRQVAHLRDGRLGSVSVAATPTLAAAFLHPALAAFQAKNAGLRVAIRSVPTDQTLELVARREVDFGIAYGPVTAAGLEVDDLGAAQLACVLRDDHPLARKRVIRTADLRGETVASYRADTPFGREMRRVLHEAGEEIAVGVQANAITAVQLAQNGLAVSLIDPLALTGGVFESLTIRPFEPDVATRVQLVRPRGETVSRSCERLLQGIRSVRVRYPALPVGGEGTVRPAPRRLRESRSRTARA